VAAALEYAFVKVALRFDPVTNDIADSARDAADLSPRSVPKDVDRFVHAVIDVKKPQRLLCI
jgi:hypothetical protein